jgi:aminocarboxymuconate-semialdehyde decarboxylase
VHPLILGPASRWTSRVTGLWSEEEQGMPLAQALEPIYVDSVVYQPANLRYLVDTIGADHVAFGTDFPRPAQSEPAGTIVATLDDAAAAWVRDGTAAALLGLEH